MKRIKYFIILVLSTIILIPNVFADEAVTFNHEQQNIINENGELIGVELTFNIVGTDVVAIQHDIEYDSEKLDLKEITPNGSFTLTKGDIKKHGKKSSLSIVVDGDYAYSSAPYMKMYFEFTDKFVNYSSAIIRFTNVKSAGIAERLIKMNGKQITLTINGNNMLSSSSTDIDNEFTVKEWIENHKFQIYFGIFILVVAIVLDILYVSFKNRKPYTPFNTNARFQDNNAKHLRNSFTDTQENENKANGIDPDKYKYKSIALLMLGLSILTIGTIYAVQGQKNQDIRDYIVGKKVSLKKEELDISGDGEINVLDLIMEKTVRSYEIIKINEWNTEFLRNMNLYHIDLYHSKIPLEVYSVEYGKTRHIIYTTSYDINAMECELGTIENFKKIDYNNTWTYEFDYTLNEGKDNCYMQAVAGN